MSANQNCYFYISSHQVGTVMDAQEVIITTTLLFCVVNVEGYKHEIYIQVMVLITGAHKSLALYKAIEEGVNHMWTVSAFQQHPNTLMICDEDATLELKVKTVKYFKVCGRGC